jgi:hypothetical protein
MPCLPSPRRTSRPESVTAERIFLATTSGGSITSTVPCGVPRVVDILLPGSCRSITRSPLAGMAASGSGNSSPNRELKRCAMLRASSRC